jgi:hypothetical protein
MLSQQIVAVVNELSVRLQDQLARDDGSVDSGGYRVTTVRQNMGRTPWLLATTVMVKILL